MGVKLWITNLMELRHAINGWPKSEDYVTVCDGGQHGSFDDEGYQKALAKAKEESILVEQSDNTPITMFKGVLEPDEFIDFQGSVEVSYQCNYRQQGFYDCPKGLYDEYIKQGITDKVRQVARLKPVDKYGINSPVKPCEHCGAKEDQDCQHGGGSCPWADDAASGDWLKPVDSGAMSFTEAHVYGGSGPEVPEDIDASKPDSIFTREDVREMMDRIKELEDALAAANKRIRDMHDKEVIPYIRKTGQLVQELAAYKTTDPGVKHYYDSSNGKELEHLDGPGVPMIQNEGLKDRILEAFCREYDGESMAYAMLIKVLDDLKIK